MSIYPPVSPPTFVGVQDDATSYPWRGRLDFGANLTVSDEPANGRLVIDASGGGSVTFAAGSGLPVYNVKSSPYNATGNGTTDDRAAIQAAIDAAQAVGGIVFFPVGTYKITAPLVISSANRVTLKGELCRWGYRESNRNWTAKGAVIWNASTTGDCIQINGGPATAGSTQGGVIEDLGIDTPPPSGVSGVTSWDPTGWGPLSSGAGIRMQNGWVTNWTIRGCVIARHHYGISMTPKTLGTGTGVGAYNVVENCYVCICKQIGIDASGVGNRVFMTQVYNNDPEWDKATQTYGSSGDAAQGYVGIRFSGEGNWVERCNVICYRYGYVCGTFAPEGAGGAATGYVTDWSYVTSCFADACAYCYVIGGNNHWVHGNGGTACYFNPAAASWTPAETQLLLQSNTTSVVGFKGARGKVGLDCSGASGCSITGGVFTAQDSAFVALKITPNVVYGCAGMSFQGNYFAGYDRAADFTGGATTGATFVGNTFTAASTLFNGSPSGHRAVANFGMADA